MKTFVTCILSAALALTSVCGSASAASVWDQPLSTTDWDSIPADSDYSVGIKLDKTVYSAENTVITLGIQSRISLKLSGLTPAMSYSLARPERHLSPLTSTCTLGSICCVCAGAQTRKRTGIHTGIRAGTRIGRRTGMHIGRRIPPPCIFPLRGHPSYCT